MDSILRTAYSYFSRRHKDFQHPKEHLLKSSLNLSDLPAEFEIWWLRNKDQFLQRVSEWEEKKIYWCAIGDMNYPKEFLTLERPPVGFFYQGSPCWVGRPRLGVVGARAITSEAKQWMQTELVEFLDSYKGCTVSGGARGVDQQLHLQSLRKKVPTIVFLPSGLGQIYPQDLESIRPEILEQGGAIISELDQGEGMRTFHFHRRNQLLVQISYFLLVIQAELRSGSHMSAKLAIESGCEIGVLPAGPWQSRFSANLDLLRMGVPMICDAKDLAHIYAKQNVHIVGL